MKQLPHASAARRPRPVLAANQVPSARPTDGMCTARDLLAQCRGTSVVTPEETAKACNTDTTQQTHRRIGQISPVPRSPPRHALTDSAG
eukprot:1668398-Rhodomonas_salina.4